MKRKPPTTQRPPALYARVREILEAARTGITRTVNTTQVVANWLIGREIVEEEQRGSQRAEYGARLLEELSKKLKQDFGAGYSVQNLRYMRQFYVEFPALIRASPIRHTLCGELPLLAASTPADEICHTPCGESDRSPKDWKPGQLHPNLSWSLYRHLLRVEKPEARSFYEIEATHNNWSARELERQINSLLYERLALSRDKKGLLRLARKGQEIQGPLDVFKDPLALEFLTIPAAAKLVESDLEAALLNELQAFLLELGKGFAFVSRQERITLDGDHFYIDLVFYHIVLKCFVLVDLKVRKLTHEDLGQFQFCLNYYDRERRTPGDQPTLGLILCTDKNDAVVRYTPVGLAVTLGKCYFASVSTITAKQLHQETKAVLNQLERGEAVVVTRRGRAIARLEPLVTAEPANWEEVMHEVWRAQPLVKPADRMQNPVLQERRRRRR